MGMIDGALVNIDNDTENANSVKLCVLRKLLKDNVISKDEFDKYCNEYQIIIVKDSWFKQWIDKFKGGESDGYIFKYVNFND